MCESAQLAQNGARFKKTRGSWQGQVALQSTGLLLQATPESALTAQADAAHPLHGFRLEVGLSAVEADFAEHDAHCRSWPPLPERWPLRAGARAAFLLLKAFPEEVVQDPEWPPPSSPSTISDGADLAPIALAQVPQSSTHAEQSWRRAGSLDGSMRSLL